MNVVIKLALLLLIPGYLQASVVILNGLTHTHSITATTKVQGTIRVKNDAEKESRILVYRQDVASECGKSANYSEIGSHGQSLGDDLKTNVDDKVMAAHEEYDVRYTVELNKDKIKAGTYWEVIMIEVANPVREDFKNGIQINSKVRYAIQVIVDTGDYEGPKLTFENVSFEKIAPGHSVLKVQIKNNGIFGARTGVILEVYDANGNKLKTTEPSSRMLYPGYCSTYELALNNLVPGKYDCVIIADTSKDLFGSNISVQVE